MTMKPYSIVRQVTLRALLVGSASAMALGAGAAMAAETASVDEEIVVTGSRIVREGYEAPTPLTVISNEDLENRADANLVNMLSTMPAITGANTASVSSSRLGQGNGGLQTLNLRSLGGTRVLVLLDGQRTVASHYSNVVSIDNFPSQLVERVDVVTGGASAVYGSDAVAGVVNFILDRDFTGIKGEVSGGLTNYGDEKNYKVALSAGFGFAGGRGHVLLSGEHMYTGGIDGSGGRSEQAEGWLQMTNPAYTASNGQPQLLFLPNSATSGATAGGIIVAGPLKGTAFGANGVPYQFRYGSIVSGSNMYGGDWKENDIRPLFDLSPSQENDSIFTRASYDLSDNIMVYGQWSWSQNKNDQAIFPAWLLGGPTTYVVQIDNAFLPETTRAAMVANGITSFGIGTWNQDMGRLRSFNSRITHRVSGGFEGTFDAFNSEWNWNANYNYGSTKVSLNSTVPSASRYRLAMDSVRNAAGQIVCRSVLNGANNGCKPWNPMGVGVNTGNEAAAEWIRAGRGFQIGLIELQTFNAAVTGAPFESWAGPVSLALSAEHRTDEIHAVADFISMAGDRTAGNYAPLDGKQSVTEGALETVIPLANGADFAQAWDLNAAVRFTDYELAGYVTTWKVGTTYTLNDTVKFRVTRSRDIRAPNIQDLFAAPSFGTVGTGLIDRFLGGIPTPANAQQAVGGNVGLRPEKADTTGIGMVLSPGFLPGLTASVDYWDVKLKDAIQPLAAQQIIDSCFSGSITTLCPNIQRAADGTIRLIEVFPINLAVQNVRGIDLESSYRMNLADVNESWGGSLSLHGLMTFYLRNYQDTRFNPAADYVGQHTGTDFVLPNWKLSLTATYNLDPVTVSLTARGFSDGKIDARYIECTAQCPAATVANPTINENDAPGRYYLDANVNYALHLSDAVESDLFISARNLFNTKMPPIPSTFFFSMGATGSPYDVMGAVYRAGIRFKM